MNRPRNRQPRPPRNNTGHQPHNRQNRAPQTYTNVPTIAQVIPGSSVSIILKADQPTGREVQGIVQDLLTRGNHPRGIKVRLRDGRVGRVQRMCSDTDATAGSQNVTGSSVITSMAQARYQGDRDARLDPEGPPPRNLADFIPDLDDNTGAERRTEADDATFKSAVVKCPLCDSFEGDEVAVSHHVEEHLT